MDDYASFSTICPRCGAKDDLSVISGRFAAHGMMLGVDGFSFCDASQCDTDDVRVRCEACEAVFGLAEVTL